MRDDNYGRQSLHKTVLDFAGLKNRAKTYYWQCRECGEVFGPSELFQILLDRVGKCCSVRLAKESRLKKYESMVGELATPYKRLISFHGETEGAHPHALFSYICERCGKKYGPNQLQMIKQSEHTQCCRPGKYNILGHEELSNKRIKALYSVARRRKIECSVTAEYLVQIYKNQLGLCSYTKLPLDSIDKASLDRIDSSQGYIEGNVQWVLPEVNVMKMDLTEERFLELCSFIVSRGENEK